MGAAKSSKKLVKINYLLDLLLLVLREGLLRLCLSVDTFLDLTNIGDPDFSNSISLSAIWSL